MTENPQKEIMELITNVNAMLPEEMNPNTVTCLLAGIIQSYEMTPQEQIKILKRLTRILIDISSGNTSDYTSFTPSTRKH